jgi:hypothetical protein
MFHATGSSNSSVGGTSSRTITYKRPVKQEAVVVVPKGQSDFTVTVELTTVRDWGAASSFASVKFSTNPTPPPPAPPVFSLVKVEAEPATLVSTLLDALGHIQPVTLKATPIDQYGHEVHPPLDYYGRPLYQVYYQWDMPITDAASGRASFDGYNPPQKTSINMGGSTRKVYLQTTPSKSSTLPVSVTVRTTGITKTGSMNLVVSPTAPPPPPPPANPPATPPVTPPAVQRLSRVDIRPVGNPGLTINSGTTAKFYAKAYDTTGKQIPRVTVVFASNNNYGTQWRVTSTTNNILENDAELKFTLATNRPTAVTMPVTATVTYGGVTKVATGWVKVNPIIPVIKSVTIQQRSAAIKSGDSFAFAVKLKDQDGKDITEFYQQYGITLKWATSSGTAVVLNASSDKTRPSFSIRPVLQGSNTMTMVMIGIEVNQNGKKVTDYVTARVIR